MTEEEFLIHELAERAGISVRTIRYYINEGLLPPPSYKGKYSYYSRMYVDRLELIRRLKESYLPLSEIREVMNSLTDEQVRRRLIETPPSSPKQILGQSAPQPATKPGTRALDYINQVMDSQTKYRMKGTTDQPQLTFSKEREAISQPNILTGQRQSLSEEDEFWQRISLAPGVELSFRLPLNPEVGIRVHQLLSYARKIFQTKP